VPFYTGKAWESDSKANLLQLKVKTSHVAKEESEEKIGWRWNKKKSAQHFLVSLQFLWWYKFLCLFVSLFRVLLVSPSSSCPSTPQKSRKSKSKELKKTKHLGYLMVGSETNEKDLPSATATAVELLK
jgi:hypothetical protein